MRAEHHQFLPSPSTVVACKSSHRQVYFLPYLYPAPNISLWSVFCSLSDLHLQQELGAFPINQNLPPSPLNTSALPYCSSGTTSGSLLACFKMTRVYNFHLRSYQYPEFLPFTSESRSTNPLLSFLFDETPKY